MKVVGDVTKYYVCECCKKASDAEDKRWWIKTVTDAANIFGDCVPETLIPWLIAEAQKREREKCIFRLNKCLDQMPVAGNGRRLLMQLINKMEEGI
jgi:hypothetical protein